MSQKAGLKVRKNNMTKTPNNHPLEKKLNRLIYLLETLLALELNKTNLDRNKIRDRLGIDKAKVNKMLEDIERDNFNKDKAKGKSKKTKTKNRKKKIKKKNNK